MRPRWLLGIASVAGLLLSADARAQDAPPDTLDIQSILSERVITTASTTAQKASVAPALSTTITSDDLRLYGIRTLAEAIDFLSVGVVTANPLRAPDIGSRGVLFGNDEGKHFLLLIDGHAVNDPLYGAAHFDEGAGIPIDVIDHLEVIVGPGSVLYGSNAMMGVINVFTKSAAQYRGGHLLAEYEPGGGVRASAGTGFQFDIDKSPVEVTVAVQYDQRFGPDLTFPYLRYPTAVFGAPFPVQFGANEPGQNVWGGTVRNANFTQAPAGIVRVRSGDLSVSFLASASRQGVPYATATQPVLFDDPNSYELDRVLRLDVRHQTLLSALMELTSRAYADVYDRQLRIDVPGGQCQRGTPQCEYLDVGLTRWAGVEERLSLNWLDDHSLVTLLGVDAREQWASAKEDIFDPTTGRTIAPTAGHINTSASLIAPLLQQTYSPTGWLDLNAGARLDADSRFSPVLSPRGAIAVRPASKTTFKAIYSQAFRAPTWSEFALANYQLAPSNVTQPETVRSLEAAVEQRFATHRLQFGVFRSWWANLVESATISNADVARLTNEGRIPTVVGTLAQYRNVASVDNYGWTGSVDGSFDEGRLVYGASATGAFTRKDDGSGPVPLTVAPQVFGNAHIAYRNAGYWPTPALAVAFAGPREVDRRSAVGVVLPAAPSLADFRLTLSGRVPAAKGWSYGASIDYVTADRSPYAAGPDLSLVQVNQPGQPLPAFVPIDQFRAFFGLRYDFLTGSQETQ